MLSIIPKRNMSRYESIDFITRLQEIDFWIQIIYHRSRKYISVRLTSSNVFLAGGEGGTLHQALNNAIDFHNKEVTLLANNLINTSENEDNLNELLENKTKSTF